MKSGTEVRLHSLFSPATGSLPAELFETLAQTPHLKLERIVSRGHATPPGEWYDQRRDEWVVLLAGRAGLRIEHQTDLLELKPGDYCLLPARCRHRVEWTDPDTDTIWLALHFDTYTC